MTRFDELTARVNEIYEVMDSHPDGRDVWRTQNADMSRELDELEEEADWIEQEEIDYRKAVQ